VGILDLFSNRMRPPPDVFQYDELPEALRVQIVHIIEDVMGPYFGLNQYGWSQIAKAIAKEHGLLNLPGQAGRYGRPSDPFTDCLNYVLQAETPEALSMIELCFRILDQSRDHAGFHVVGDRDDAIEELNQRFRQHGVGYHYESGSIVRVDSQLLHNAVVVPALALLRTKGFEGPNKEFLSAHEHFRHGRIEEAVIDACKAFESTMKAICTAKKWTYDPKATAAPLIKLMIDKGVIPSSSTEQLENVAKCLVGVASVRNKNAGHGAGATPRSVPDHYAAYALHLAASNIVFLVDCYKAMP